VRLVEKGEEAIVPPKSRGRKEATSTRRVMMICWKMGSIRRRVEKTTMPSIDELGVRCCRKRKPGFEVSVIVRWDDLGLNSGCSLHKVAPDKF